MTSKKGREKIFKYFSMVKGGLQKKLDLEEEDVADKDCKGTDLVSMLKFVFLSESGRCNKEAPLPGPL